MALLMPGLQAPEVHAGCVLGRQGQRGGVVGLVVLPIAPLPALALFLALCGFISSLAFCLVCGE